MPDGRSCGIGVTFVAAIRVAEQVRASTEARVEHATKCKLICRSIVYRPFPVSKMLGSIPMRFGILGLLWAVALPIAASAQDDIQAFDVVQGQRLAVLICANCHVVPNQRGVPLLRPPASSFEEIAQRSYITSDWIRNFLRTTHRDELSPSGMPDPMLIDQHINQITAYLMSIKAAR